MSTLSPRPLPPTLLSSLNALLAALDLPFTLDHPTDLTPSLLLAIFESLINARLPIAPSVRQSRTREAKSRAMLVLLGVLECDVLRGGTDANVELSVATSNADESLLGGAGGVSVDGWVDEIGLGEVDPERLANGGWEETIFVGELLCWLARRRGILPRTRSSNRSSHPRSLYSDYHSYGTEEGEGDTADFSTSLLLQPSSTQKSRSPRSPSPSPSIDDPNADADISALSHITDVPRHPLVHSPEPSFSASATTGTDLSIRARSVSSRTSVSGAHDDPDEFEEASQDTLQMYDPRRMIQDAEDDDDQPPTFRPHCIHELEDPSYIRDLAGPSSSFDPSVSHERVYEDEDEDRDDPSRDEEDDVDEQDNDDRHTPPTPTPRRVRLTGWIDTVDAATELSHFATSRSHSALASSKHSSPRPPSSPPPSPPSPTTHSDPSFDLSFSNLNNTSTPAKPRPQRRPQFQTTPRREIVTQRYVEMDRSKTGGSIGTATRTGRPRPRHRERSPSYTPSPPSFSTPGSLRSGGAGGTSGMGTGTRVGSTASGAKTRSSASGSGTAVTSSSTRRKQRSRSPPLSLSSTKGKSSVALAGSTATTHTLLTERARLLTELATLKRVRAASAGGSGTGGGGRVVNHRVDVGV